jgi:hypothetical protein
MFESGGSMMTDEPMTPDAPPVPFTDYLGRAAMLAVIFGVLAFFSLFFSRDVSLFTGTLFGAIAIILGIMIKCRHDADRHAVRQGDRGIIYGFLIVLSVWLVGVPVRGGHSQGGTRSQSTNNLKQIGIAAHSFADAQTPNQQPDDPAEQP